MPEKPECLSQAPQALKTLYDQVTSKTRGLLVFQEQLIKLLVQAGGVGFEDAEKVRRSIAKKTGETEVYRSQFAQGCARRLNVLKFCDRAEPPHSVLCSQVIEVRVLSKARPPTPLRKKGRPSRIKLHGSL